MDPAVQYMLAGGGALLLFLIGVVWQVVTSRMDTMQASQNAVIRDFNEHKLKVATDYVSRDGLKDMLEPIMAELKKIDETQQKLFDRLDGKADKP